MIRNSTRKSRKSRKSSTVELIYANAESMESFAYAIHFDGAVGTCDKMAP